MKLLEAFSNVPMFNPTRAPAHEGLGSSFSSGNSQIVPNVDPAAVQAFTSPPIAAPVAIDVGYHAQPA